MSKLISRLLRHSKQVRREEDGEVHYDQVIEECNKKQFDNTEPRSDEMLQQFALLRIGHLKMDISSDERWRTKEKIFFCLNPKYPHQFLYLRVIQGHSGSTINPALQVNVLLSKCSIEYIYHVGNGKELMSIVNHGLIPGGVSLRTDRQAVFFSIVDPMDNQDDLRETLYDLSQVRIASYKNTWKRFQNTVF